MPSEWYELHLPRWDTAWEVTGHRPGKNGKLNPIKVRRTWDALQGNARGNHWGGKAKATKEVINAVAWAATAQKIPQCKHMMVQLHWAPGDNRRADEDNLWPLFKVCCDGLARGRSDLPGLAEPHELRHQVVVIDGERYMVRGVETYAVLGPQERFPISLLVVPL